MRTDPERTVPVEDNAGDVRLMDEAVPVSRSSPIRVLIVEDRRSDAVLVLEMLRGHDRTTFACRHASTLQEALKQLLDSYFDCVLVDMNLPDSDGLETLHSIQAAARGPAVIVLTGLDDGATAETAMARGAQDYLTKGRIDGGLLASAIRHAVERKRIHDQLAEREEQAQKSLSELTSALAALAESETRYRSVLSALDEGVLLHDALTRVTTFNESAQRILGLTPEKLLGCRASDLGSGFGGPDGTCLPFDGLPVRRALQSGTIERQVVGLTRLDGSIVWLAVTCNPVNDPLTGKPTAVVTSLVDITERRELERQLSQRALHDALTGLPNRLVLTDQIKAAVSRMKRTGKAVALLFIDLDHFKSINDTYGHDAGDELLVQASDRLRAALRTEDTLARLGGDELVAVCEDLSCADDAMEVARRLTEALSRPFPVGGAEVMVTASIGIAIAHVGVDPEDLLKHADRAMYQAKNRGRARFDVYDDALAAKSRG